MAKKHKEVPDETLHEIYVGENFKFKLELVGSHQQLGIIVSGEDLTHHLGTIEIQRRCHEIGLLMVKELRAKAYLIDGPDSINEKDPYPWAAANIKENKKITLTERPPWHDSEIAAYDQQVGGLRKDVDDICTKHKASLNDICDEKMVRESKVTAAMLRKKSTPAI